MNEEASRSAAPHVANPTLSAGAMLRQARQAQGLHIVALAAAIKVTPRKLELLENDRPEELPDPAFARALAKAVCRVLKIDAEPVLARLPHPAAHGLDRVARSKNTPFRERSSRGESSAWAVARKPAVWGPLLILAGAGALWLLPASLLPQKLWSSRSVAGSAAPASAGTADAAASSVIVETIFPPLEAASAPDGALAVTAPPAPPAGALTVRTTGESWVEVRDAKGHSLLSRVLRPGEEIGLDGTAPLRVTVGNAAVTQVTYHGRPVALPPPNRDNVVRLELK
jgi:cytoskeleton protein RodZ